MKQGIDSNNLLPKRDSAAVYSVSIRVVVVVVAEV
jgi:hypothetical protein